MDHVSDEPELPQQPSETSGLENNVAPGSKPDVSMPDAGPPETPDESAETSDDDRENTAEPVPHTAVHTGNGDQSTKCLLQNLVILW